MFFNVIRSYLYDIRSDYIKIRSYYIRKTQKNIPHHINGHLICTNSNILISYVSHMLTYMQHMSHHLSDTCVFVFWKCPDLCLQYVWCSVFICFVCGTDMFSIMNSLWCFAFSKCFVYAQSKRFTYTHQMFTCANQMTESVMAIKQWVFTWNLSCLPDLFTILGHQHIYERIHATYTHHVCKT